MTERQEKLARFYNDPEWYFLEEEILEFIEPLLDVFTIDINSTPEDVKAQVMSRRIAYEQMTKFLESSRLLKVRESKDKESFE